MPAATNLLMSTLQERAQGMIWPHQHDIWVVLVIHDGEGIILALHDSLQSTAERLYTQSLKLGDDAHMLQQTGHAHATEQTLVPSELNTRYVGRYINASQAILTRYVQEMHMMQCLTLNSEHHAFLGSKLPCSIRCIKAVEYSPLQNSVPSPLRQRIC